MRSRYLNLGNRRRCILETKKLYWNSWLLLYRVRELIYKQHLLRWIKIRLLMRVRIFRCLWTYQCWTIIFLRRLLNWSYIKWILMFIIKFILIVEQIILTFDNDTKIISIYHSFISFFIRLYGWFLLFFK